MFIKFLIGEYCSIENNRQGESLSVIVCEGKGLSIRAQKKRGEIALWMVGSKLASWS